MKAVLVVALLVFSSCIIPVEKKEDEWIMHARIATPYGYNLSWEEGLAKAVSNGANVILDWAGFSDTYQGRILDFNQSLQDFVRRAEYVHFNYPDVKYMVYFAPLEMGTPDSDMNKDGRDDDGGGSTYTDHPEWLQVGIDGRKAVFYGSMPDMPFWVDETSEDTWLSPSNKEYRDIIMEEAKEIAKYADAIWFDVPHLCFEFGEGWQNQWSSVDESSRAAFHNDTGLVLPPPPIQPDWHNETWLKFVEWRYKQILDFVRDFNNAIKEGNQECKLVIETSTNGLFITQHGCDIERIPDVCDIVAHEYGGPFYRIQYYAWLYMLATLKQWYDFDEIAGKNTSWLLSYVMHGDTALANFHAAMLSTMGFNYYTSGNEGMAGIVDEEFMREFFKWIDEYDEYLYGWDSNADVAVVFSRRTIDYLEKGSWGGYAYIDEFPGILMMLIESNIPFKVISENNLGSLSNFSLVILPDFACMNESQAEEIKQYVASGGKITAINETSLYTEYGWKRENFLLHDIFGVNYSNVKEEIYENNYGGGKSIFTIIPLGRYFCWAAEPWSNYSNRKEAEEIKNIFLKMIEKASYIPPYEIEGNVIVIPYENGKEKMLRILNFNGIGLGNAIPESQQIVVRIRGNVENARLLNFMNGLKDVDVIKEGNQSIISFTLHTQATLLYSMNETPIYASIVKPEEGEVYFMDREIMRINSKKAIVIGKISVEVDTNGNKVEFYVDNELKFVDEEIPFHWLWDEITAGVYEIKVLAYGRENDAEDALNVIKIL